MAVVRQCELEYTKYPRLGVIKLDKLNVGSISVDCFSWWTINRKGKVGGMTYNQRAVFKLTQELLLCAVSKRR